MTSWSENKKEEFTNIKSIPPGGKPLSAAQMGEGLGEFVGGSRFKS